MVKKTILMLSPFSWPNIGGVESYLGKLTKYLIEHDHRVYLLTYQPLTTRAKGARLEKGKNLEIHRVPWFGKGLFPILEPCFPLVFLYLFPGLFIKSLFFYLRRRREIDVIHAHGLIAAAIAKILTLLFKKRAVVSIHAIYHLPERRVLAWLVKRLLRSFDCLLVTGPPSKEELVSIGLSEDKIELYPNWVDLNFFKPLDKKACRTPLKLLKHPFLVLFVGRFLEKKGVSVLLDVAESLKEVGFIFVGDGPLESRIKKAATEYKNINFVGKVPREKLVYYYNAVDLFVAPCQYEEGFAAVYLEALGCGTPVIAAQKGCLPYFINSRVGRVIEPTVSNVRDEIEYFYHHPQELKELKNNCRAYAIENFSEKRAKIITNAYEA